MLGFNSLTKTFYDSYGKNKWGEMHPEKMDRIYALYWLGCFLHTPVGKRLEHLSKKQKETCHFVMVWTDTLIGIYSN